MRLLKQDPLSNLLSSQHQIVLNYKGDVTKISKGVFSKIDIDLVVVAQLDPTDNTVTICPEPRNEKFTYNPIPEEFSKRLKDYVPKEIIIPDFRNSDQLYKLCKGTSSKFKVIRDSYSYSRGAILFEYIATFESGLRDAYIKKFGLDNINTPASYRKKDVDHKVTQLNLFEIIDKEISSPCTERYYLNFLETNKGESGLLKARSLTKLDEMEISISQEDLNKFREIRNKAMHFRVVTRQDVIDAIELTSKLGQSALMNIVRSIKSGKIA